MAHKHAAPAYKVQGGWVVADLTLAPLYFLADPTWTIYPVLPTLPLVNSSAATVLPVANTLQSVPYNTSDRSFESWLKTNHTYTQFQIGSRGTIEYENTGANYEIYRKYPKYSGPHALTEYCYQQTGSTKWLNETPRVSYNSYMGTVYPSYVQYEGGDTGIFIAWVRENRGDLCISYGDQILVNNYYVVHDTHTKDQNSSITTVLVSNKPRQLNIIDGTDIIARNGTDQNDLTTSSNMTPDPYTVFRDIEGHYHLSEGAPCNHDTDYVLGTKTVTGSNVQTLTGVVYDVSNVGIFLDETFDGESIAGPYETILYKGYIDIYDELYSCNVGTTFSYECSNDTYETISRSRSRKYFYGIVYGARYQSKHYSIQVNTMMSGVSPSEQYWHYVLGYRSLYDMRLIEISNLESGTVLFLDEEPIILL